MRELIYPKKNVCVKVFIVLTALALAAAVYFVYDIYRIQNELDCTFSDDCSNKTYIYSKKGLAAPPGVSLTEQLPDYENYYQTPLGFPVISFSDKWKGDKLKDIYSELIKNKHGDEINLLSGVVLYPDKSESGEIAVAGTHVMLNSQIPVFFHLPGVVPQSLQYQLVSQNSVIELYNMDAYNEVADVAKTLSHEYGHHYTIHYFLSDDDAVKQSEYFSLRNVDNYGREVFFDNVADYYENHMWSIYELAAEDYVQIMGSPNAKQTLQFYDVFDVLTTGKDNPKVSTSIYNVFPQENIYMPLAHEVSGLSDYFLSFIGEQSDNKPLSEFDFNVRIEKKSNYGRKYYNILWDKSTRDKNALYTLICYNDDDQVFQVVRTVTGNGEAVARVGTAAKMKKTQKEIIYNYLELQDSSTGEKITDKPRYFKLYVLLPDGRMQSSKLYYFKFN